MILPFVLVSLALSSCWAALAGILEKRARAERSPTRWVWLAGIVASAALPIISAVGLRDSVGFAPTDWLVIEGSEPELAVLGVEVNSWLRSGTAIPWASIDQLLLALWAGASALMIVKLVRSARVLSRVVNDGTLAPFAGTTVLISHWFGPAVVGLRRPRIVVPRSLLCLDARLASMVVRHETEHCKAKDQAIVLIGQLCVVLLPWNFVIGHMFARLRLAVEIDCDARTVASGADPSAYKRLLLLVAHAGLMDDALVAMSSPFRPAPQQLSVRLAAIDESTAWRSSVSRHRMRLVSQLAMFFAVMATAVTPFPSLASRTIGSQSAPTATVDGPHPRTREMNVVSPSDPNPSLGVLAAQDRPASLQSGPELIVYPDELRSARVEGGVLAEYIVELTGRVAVSSLVVLESPDVRFTDAIRDRLGDFRYSVAIRDGEPVRERVRFRFKFALVEAATD